MAFMRKTKQELAAALEKLDQAEARIRDLEADVQALDRVAGMIVLSPDGLIERVNDIALEALGYQRDELVGNHHRVFCSADYSRSEEYIRFWRELAIGRAQQGTFEAVTASGASLQLDARYSPVMNDKGLSRRVIALITSFRDTALA
ncbi:PAS domain-containing protein [Marinobacter sp. VGCF2001]|uniref:PAS domain-containing protein n=1 Tax=Marinobacter sp. VGCF2001 TaxID=3417189 RepID=UPI003CE89C1A